MCRIISRLHAYQKIREFNESDQNILKQAQNALIGESGFILSIKEPANGTIVVNGCLAQGTGWQASMAQPVPFP